jgi:hypothetical protein
MAELWKIYPDSSKHLKTIDFFFFGPEFAFASAGLVR